MRFDLDKAFGVHDQALLVRSQRAQILAENLANADTPNYKARDLDFKAMLSSASEQIQSTAMRTTHVGHINGDTDVYFGNTMYRNPLQPALDGNTVDTQMEKAEFMRNAMAFQTSMKFLDGKIKTLMSAIKGE